MSIPSGNGQTKVEHLIIKQTDDWPEPMNLFETLNLGEPNWTYGMAPPEINDFAFDESERMGGLPASVAGPAIVAAAACINDCYRIMPKQNDYTWTESPRLWIATIGDSSSKKTPAKKRADSPILKIEKARFRQFKQEMELYEIEYEKYEALSKSEKRSSTPPKKPEQKRLMCSDITIEAMRDLLRDGGGASKILCSSDELSGFFGAFDIYRGQSKTASRDRACYLEMYNGGPKIFDRVASGNIYIPNWSACISGTITPDMLLDVFGRMNTDGLLQRFLIYKAKYMGSGEDRIPNRAAEEQYENVIKRLIAMPPSEQGTVFRLSEEAQKIRYGFEQLVELAQYLPGTSSALNAHINKYPGLFCRLALTYHLITNPESNVISGQVAHMAATALFDYHFPVALDFYRQLGFKDQKIDTARSVASYILAKGFSAFSVRDIIRGVRAVKNDAKLAKSQLEMLEIYGWVRGSRELGEKNRYRWRWRVNPKVHILFEEHGEKERLRRAEGAKNIRKAVAAFQK